ncbi:hypothetical protein GMSM_42430 [Geomonas sp. Red276]
MDKKTYLSIMAALGTAAAVCLFALLAAPIATPLAWALIIGVATLPHYDRLARKFPGHPGRTAGVMVLAVAICFVLPMVALVVTLALNAADWYKEGVRLAMAFKTTAAGSFSHLPFAHEIASLGERFGIDISGMGAKLAAGASGYLLAVATSAAKNLGDLLFTLAMGLFILFPD